jgi:hypothetical protein
MHTYTCLFKGLKMKKILLLLLLLSPSVSIAQVNIETIRSDADSKDFFFGQVKGGLELQRGNVEITSYGLELISHLKTIEQHLFLKLSTSQGEQGDTKFKNESFGHLRWTFMPWPVGFEVFTQFQHDEFKSLRLRQLNGVGLRLEVFRIKDDSTFVMSLGSGAMTDYELLTNGNEDISIRSTTYLSVAKSFDKKKKNLILLTLYYQPLFANPKDYRINIEANLNTILISSWNISISNSVNFLYDTNPPDDVLTNDLIVKTSLVYNW